MTFVMFNRFLKVNWEHDVRPPSSAVTRDSHLGAKSNCVLDALGCTANATNRTKLTQSPLNKGVEAPVKAPTNFNLSRLTVSTL